MAGDSSTSSSPRAAAALDLADKLGGKSKIGRDHVLGYSLHELGEGLVEMVVPLFPGKSVDEQEVLLRRGKGPLDDKPEIAVQLRDPVADFRRDPAVEDGDLGRLDCLNIIMGWLLPVKTLKIGDPPVFDSKLNDLLDAVLLYEIHPETTL